MQTSDTTLKQQLRVFRLSSAATGTSENWHTKSASHWLQVCREHAFTHGQVKVGELGGGQDTPFEQAFSNLAHAYVKDKAPKLLDYEVGFQLLEKNQENTKAVGVFGFKVGNQWLYGPVFFLNGDLKGHELLYLKNQDAFVPMDENWIDHILGKKSSVLGDGVNRNLSLLGVMPPNLYQLSRSPQKFASDQMLGKPIIPVNDKNLPKMASWAWDYLPIMARLATVPLEKDAQVNLPGFLGEDKDILRFFLEKVAQTYPTLLEAMDHYYGPDMLSEVIKSLAAKEKAANSRSILKKGVASSALEHPKGWNGGMTQPSKVNGGVTSFGGDAWHSSQIGRRFERKHGGAIKGEIQDMARHAPRVANEDETKDIYKEGNYPGCGMSKPSKPKKAKLYSKKTFKKRGSIIPSLIGPEESQPTKHKVISKEMIEASPDVVHDLSADERKTLLKERVVFRDTRDKRDVTIAYNVQTPLKLQNPDHTDIYLVLCQPDKFVKCLVIMGPYDHRHRHSYCTVVRLEGEKTYVNTHPANVWIRSEYDNDAWREWLKDQKDVGDIPIADRDNPWNDRKRYIIIGPTGQATVPFQAREKYTGGGTDSVVYDVRFDNHSWSKRPAYLPDHAESMADHSRFGSDWRSYSPDRVDGLHDPYSSGFSGSKEQISVGPELMIKFKINYGVVSVPTDSKLITVQDDEGAESSESVPLELGNLGNCQSMIMAQTFPLRVVSDGKDMTVNDNRMDKTSAIIHLFRDHGLSEKVAKYIVDEAMRRQKYECRLEYTDYIRGEWEKKAESDMIRGAPNAPPFPEPYMGYDPMTGSNVPTMQESEFNVKIPDMSAAKTDRSIYYPMGPDPKSMQVAQDAASTGQKEVFDTAMLGGLLKAVRQDSMVDKYLGDVMKGLDRLGRILFQYYWHGEEFEERYGKQDMPELEDGLRNAFEGLGDIILALKRKAVEPTSDENSAVDLGPVANQ